MVQMSWQDHSPEKLLVERFHITTGFHPGQRAIIERLVQGKRILAIQQTGWGKSLCYQMASLYYPHLTIVFSPLKALMRDQCRRCNEVYEIPSAIVSSDFSEAENEATLARAVEGEIKVLYIAPERLSNRIWQQYVLQMRISMIVIDEAHCISIWGHDFRPDYRRIMRLLDALPEDTAVLALTATANKRVEADILQQMGIGVQVMRESAVRFLEEEYLPRIEKRGSAKTPAHEEGWALSGHETSRIGRLVRACKYENAGPFPLSLVVRAVEVLYTRYPIAEINGIISIPPTISGTLVEDFARQVAAMVNIEYLPVLTKIRDTLEQKSLKNRLQKEDNVKGAFVVQSPELVAGRTLLLIDDIYDSGKMLQEAGRTLMRAGACAVHPLTITRTLHSDDQ